MSFKFIYDSRTNKKHSIFSYEGKSLLKQYIKDYQTGGSKKSSFNGANSKSFNEKTIRTLDDVMITEKLDECKRKLDECKRTGKVKLVKRLRSMKDEINQLKGHINRMENTNSSDVGVGDVGVVGDVGGGGGAKSTNTDEKKLLELKIEKDSLITINGEKNQLTEANKKGSGMSKHIYEVKYDKKSYALAKIPEDGLDKKRYENELNCLKNLNHPNILKLYDTSKSQHFHYMLMEYGMANLTKYRGMGNNDEKKPAESKERLQLTHNFLIDMSKALQYLKEMNVNHRDIKLENFVIVETSDKPVVKLIDFGISTRCPGTERYNKDDTALSIGDEDGGKQKIFEAGGGTQFYVAPENVGESSYDTHKGDIFAFGICILELFYSHEPNHLKSYSQMGLNMQPIKTRIETNFPDIADITEFYNGINNSIFNGKSIIQQILDPNPTNRTDIEPVLRELNKSLKQLVGK